ncbi:FAD linked oxidase [Trypanosoma melophagium]|uniref:FAD linked oxidase n=1 Tax=Trypanosoma melophagium TaxID=715481 RepID=UPI00351A9B8F|nr:FAD linked oxidase [Trypanosoma melophagium]
MVVLSAARQRALHYAWRNVDFVKLQPKHLEYFSSILQEPCPNKKTVGKILTQPDKIAPFNRDWMNQVEGECPAVLLPTSTQHVAAILRYCQEEKIAIVPQCGNTGLVYGSSALHDEIILSLREMNAEPVVSKKTMSAESEAGVVLQHLQDVAKAHDLLVPLTMGSKGSAQIGGTVSTNAGGIHFARYGSMHANVLGIEVVTAKGDILNMMSTLRKDNAGYDLKHLFIGSEGTLGVVTRASLKLFPFPRSAQLALFRLQSFEAVLELYRLAQEHLAESLSAFEVMDGESLLTTPQEELPFNRTNKSDIFRTGNDYSSAYFAVLVETNGGNADHDVEKLAHFVEAAEENPLCTNKNNKDENFEPILSQSLNQTAQLWKIREDTPVRLASAGITYKFDISFPLDKFYMVVEHFRELLYKNGKFNPDEVLVVGYGHFGDGNIHLNIIDRTRKHSDALDAELFPAVYEFCAAHSGSISAEHGVGVQKKSYLGLSRAPEIIAVMKSLKQMMDPNGVLNPYKVLE